MEREERDTLASVFLDGVEVFFEVYSDPEALENRRTTMYSPQGTKYTSATCRPILAYAIDVPPVPDALERTRVNEVQTALSEVYAYC